MPKVNTFKSVAGVGIIPKEFEQKAAVIKTAEKERFQQQVTPGAREQEAETEGSKKGQKQNHLGARKKELPTTKTLQSKGERNRNHQEPPGEKTARSRDLKRKGRRN